MSTASCATALIPPLLPRLGTTCTFVLRYFFSKASPSFFIMPSPHPVPPILMTSAARAEDGGILPANMQTARMILRIFPAVFNAMLWPFQTTMSCEFTLRRRHPHDEKRIARREKNWQGDQTDMVQKRRKGMLYRKIMSKSKAPLSFGGFPIYPLPG